MKNIHFQVNSRIASLLSEAYTSTEKALKELVDNAWDADAELVTVLLPLPMSNNSIVIEDNGTGMTEEELRRHYLSIANDRRVFRGDRTKEKQRRVKGRKGIGKFAGLMAASEMTVETWARGFRCSFTFSQADLASFEAIQEFPLPLNIAECDPELHGTKITLNHLHQSGLSFPNPDKLRTILLQEYGREENFCIQVNEKNLAIDDAPGEYRKLIENIDGLGEVRLHFCISDTKTTLKQPGITIKVDGKAVGKPSFFGLDRKEDFPTKLLKKLFGEVDADGLKSHVTAGWDAIVENSELFQKVEFFVQKALNEAFRLQFGRDVQLAQARLTKRVHERLASLPEYKRIYVNKAITKILEKNYGEPESKLEPIVFVVLEAMESSDYRVLLEHIANSPKRDISLLADSLNEFNLAEMALFVEKASFRTSFLDNLEIICGSANTLEAQVHTALQNALWVFGAGYSMFSSNITLKKIVETFLDKKYSGTRGNERPDLMLRESAEGDYLLIEFKRPSHALTFDDYQQATKYRHDFNLHQDKNVKVLLIGGTLTAGFPSKVKREAEVDVLTFSGVISTARNQLDWYLKNLLTQTTPQA